MSISSGKSSQLRIAILGGGQIGSAFAFHFARNARHEVTIIARPNSARLAQLQRETGIVTTTQEHASTLICDALDESIPYDLVLVTVKDYQVKALLPALTRCAARKIHFMFMTFEPERLRQAVSPERAVLGMPFLQSDFDANGHLKMSVGKRETLTDDPEWAHLLRLRGCQPGMSLKWPCGFAVMFRWVSLSKALLLLRCSVAKAPNGGVPGPWLLVSAPALP